MGIELPEYPSYLPVGNHRWASSPCGTVHLRWNRDGTAILEVGDAVVATGWVPMRLTNLADPDFEPNRRGAEILDGMWADALALATAFLL